MNFQNLFDANIVTKHYYGDEGKCVCRIKPGWLIHYNSGKKNIVVQDFLSEKYGFYVRDFDFNEYSIDEDDDGFDVLDFDREAGDFTFVYNVNVRELNWFFIVPKIAEKQCTIIYRPLESEVIQWHVEDKGLRLLDTCGIVHFIEWVNGEKVFRVIRHDVVQGSKGFSVDELALKKILIEEFGGFFMNPTFRIVYNPKDSELFRNVSAIKKSEDGCHVWYFTEGGCDISMTKIGRDDPRLFVKKGS